MCLSNLVKPGFKKRYTIRFPGKRRSMAVGFVSGKCHPYLSSVLDDRRADGQANGTGGVFKEFIVARRCRDHNPVWRR